jgi:5-oxopent-3-ene-1,2,5-tricarboxylate decarboxylase / 2-hydroxyhepta-2,4-diene-1,7-dioate isomerase
LTSLLSGGRGAVYAAALNFRGSLDALGDLTRDPYKAPPQAPVLYIKPPNTWSSSGTPIVVPRGIPKLRMGGTLGVVFGRAASKVVNAADALDCIGGWIVANDVSIPHESYFRPAIRERCRDGFCPMSPAAPASAIGSVVRISINGNLQSTELTDLIRGIPELIIDVSEFLTLRTGDVLLVGEPPTASLAAPGDHVRVEIPGVGFVENMLVAE